MSVRRSSRFVAFSPEAYTFVWKGQLSVEEVGVSAPSFMRRGGTPSAWAKWYWLICIDFRKSSVEPPHDGLAESRAWSSSHLSRSQQFPRHQKFHVRRLRICLELDCRSSSYSAWMIIGWLLTLLSMPSFDVIWLVLIPSLPLLISYRLRRTEV